MPVQVASAHTSTTTITTTTTTTAAAAAAAAAAVYHLDRKPDRILGKRHCEQLTDVRHDSREQHRYTDSFNEPQYCDEVDHQQYPDTALISVTLHAFVDDVLHAIQLRCRLCTRTTKCSAVNRELKMLR